MWSLWVFPLLVILLGAGIVASITLLVLRRKSLNGKTVATVIALPFGCVLLPVGGVILLAIVSAAFQQSDTELYEEIFGYRGTISEDLLMFDDFGSGSSREIYMRAEPTTEERRRLLAIPELKPSTMAVEEFESYGEAHRFTWWTTNPSNNDCPPGQVFEADGFRGWQEFRIWDCQSTRDVGQIPNGKIFVIARYPTQ